MHEHPHSHDHSHAVTPAALLAHMVEHNCSHLQELENLAAEIGGEAGEQTRAAADTIRKGNEQLAKALAILKE